MSHIIRHLLYRAQKLKRTCCQAIVQYNLVNLDLFKKIYEDAYLLYITFVTLTSKWNCTESALGFKFMALTLPHVQWVNILHFKCIYIENKSDRWTGDGTEHAHFMSYSIPFLASRTNTFWLHTLSKWDWYNKKIYELEVLKTYVKSQNTIIQRGNMNILKLTAMF